MFQVWQLTDMWRLRDKFLFFSIYFAAKFLNRAILQKRLAGFNIVSSEIITILISEFP